MDQQNLDKEFRESVLKSIEDALRDDVPQLNDLSTGALNDPFEGEAKENGQQFIALDEPGQLQKYFMDFDRLNAAKPAAWRKVRWRIFMSKIKIFELSPLVVLRYVAAAMLGGIIFTGIYKLSAKNKKSLHVDVEGKNITVLGTAFNIETGNNEAMVTSPSLEGVKMTQEGTLEISLDTGQELVYDSVAKGYRVAKAD